MELKRALKIIVPYGEIAKNIPLEKQEFLKRVHLLFVYFCDFLSIGLDLPYDLISTDATTGGGDLLPNGTWTGSIGMIQRGEADLVVMNMIITEERWKIVDFTYPHHTDSVTFVTRKLKKDPEILAILRPFQLEVWIMLLVSVLTMNVVLYLFLRKKLVYSDVFFDVLAVLFHQAVSFRRKSCREKSLIFIWILGGMFITNCYLSLLLSFLTFPTVQFVKDIPDLANQVKNGKYKVMIRESSPFQKLLLESKDESARIIAEGIDKSPNGLGSYELYLNLSNSELAFVEKETALFFPDQDFFKANDYFFFVMESIAVRKSFSLKNKLNMVIHRITASGLYKKILEDYWFKTSLFLSLKPTEKDNLRPLTPVDVSAAFIILISGLFLASLVLAVEILMKRKTRAKTRIRN